MGENGTRKRAPLTIDQLKEVKDVASQLSFRHRLIAHIVPYSGLTLSEFIHLHRNWLTYRYDDESDGITEMSSPDSIILSVPEESPCVGTLKSSEGGGQWSFIERDEPCSRCRPDRVWQPDNPRRTNRILIRAESAVDTMYWWFNKYDSLPFSYSGRISGLVREIGNEAGLSRDFTFLSLRRTFGVLLIARGADREMVSEWLRVDNRPEALEPMYRALGKSVPTGNSERSELIEDLRRLADEIGHPPTSAEINNQGEHTYKTYCRRFGSLEEAYEVAGLGSVDMAETGRAVVPEADLLQDLRRLADDFGHLPSAREIKNQGEHSYQTYRRRFGGLEEAYEAAGLNESE